MKKVLLDIGETTGYINFYAFIFIWRVSCDWLLASFLFGTEIGGLSWQNVLLKHKSPVRRASVDNPAHAGEHQGPARIRDRLHHGEYDEDCGDDR